MRVKDIVFKDIVTRAWCAHQVLVQVTVVPVEWVTKVVSLV